MKWNPVEELTQKLLVYASRVATAVSEQDWENPEDSLHALSTLNPETPELSTSEAKALVGAVSQFSRKIGNELQRMAPAPDERFEGLLSRVDEAGHGTSLLLALSTLNAFPDARPTHHPKSEWDSAFEGRSNGAQSHALKIIVGQQVEKEYGLYLARLRIWLGVLSKWKAPEWTKPPNRDTFGTLVNDVAKLAGKFGFETLVDPLAAKIRNGASHPGGWVYDPESKSITINDKDGPIHELEKVDIGALAERIQLQLVTASHFGSVCRRALLPVVSAAWDRLGAELADYLDRVLGGDPSNPPDLTLSVYREDFPVSNEALAALFELGWPEDS